MEILGGSSFAACHYPDKSCDYKHFDVEIKKVLICHMTSRERTFKELYEFMDGSLSSLVTTLLLFLVVIGLVQVKT